MAAALGTLAAQGDLSLGRQPWSNLIKTVGEFAHPSFVDVWFGNPQLEYRSDDGTLLRTEDRRAVEADFLRQLAGAAWTTFVIGTLGSLLGALLALPLGVVTARNLGAPSFLACRPRQCSMPVAPSTRWCSGWCWSASSASGPRPASWPSPAIRWAATANCYAEAIETLDMDAVEAVRAVGAGPAQVFFNGVWPAVLPQFVSSHLYIWEFNIRDSTVLGLIGAGGLGC